VQEAMVFRSRELRAAEEQSRAKSFGPVTIRFHFHDGTILQSEFGALDEVSALRVGRARLRGVPGPAAWLRS
jgi:hypothetical protein